MTEALVSQQDNVSQLPTEDAKAVHRKVYDAIDAVYDAERSRYTRGLNGWHSDDSIAKSVGCAPALVAKVREEFFGQAIPPEEPTEEIKSLQSNMAQLEKEFQDRENFLDGLKIQMKESQKRLKETREKLKKLCEDNGWYH